MLSRVKTQGISGLIPEKTQRLEAATAVPCISQLFFLTPNDSNPACDGRAPSAPGSVSVTSSRASNGTAADAAAAGAAVSLAVVTVAVAAAAAAAR
eukprot:COSAG02_NODE_2853_length_7891_cov_7.789913_1_plen_96_part_00